MSTGFGQPMAIGVDGHEVLLREPHDFSWLSAYGRVFMVLQGSVTGCLGFGVEKDGERFYLRYAGALPHGFFGDPGRAAADMQDAEALYAKVKHPALNELLFANALPGGRVQVFRWLNGFPLSPPQENYARFRALPLLQRLAAFDVLIDLLAACERHAIIPLGLGESHIMMMETEQRIALSTIHRFRQLPCYSAPGRIPGTPWYRAPECNMPGAALDETTAVYTAGALAYTFLGDRIDHTNLMWEGSRAMLTIAGTATQARRDARQPSVLAFQQQWRQAVAAFHLPNNPILA